MNSTDHIERQSALSIEDLGHAMTRTDERFQILSFKPLLFHPKKDGIHRIRSFDWKVFSLVGFY